MQKYLKLNLGSGQRPKSGYINVDKYGYPDIEWDLERFPWPWEESSVSEILLIHVLEHLGASVETFINIMKEIYRVSAPGGQVHITVPHPRHDDFIGDPTHVRPVTPDMLQLFSKKANRQWEEVGAANTPLGLYHDIDFDIINIRYSLDAPYADEFKNGEIDQEELSILIRKYNNVIKEIEITLQVIK